MEEEAFWREILNQVNSLVNSNEYTPDIPEVGTGLNEVIAHEPQYLTGEKGQRYQEALRNWNPDSKERELNQVMKDKVCIGKKEDLKCSLLMFTFSNLYLLIMFVSFSVVD